AADPAPLAARLGDVRREGKGFSATGASILFDPGQIPPGRGAQDRIVRKLMIKETIMLGITKEDFAVRAKNFDLTDEWNILRIISGAFMFPHVAGKFAEGLTLSAPTVQFFAKAGMSPGEVWVWIAAVAEALSGICLVLGICTRYAALGAAA